MPDLLKVLTVNPTKNERETIKCAVVVPVENSLGWVNEQHPSAKDGKLYNWYVLCSVSTLVQNKNEMKQLL